MRRAAVMLIVNSDGLILSVSRRFDATKFGLPGGKVEPGEMEHKAAMRETEEETSVVVNSCTEIFKRTEPPANPGGLPFYTHCFYALAWEGTPRDSEEGVVKWLTVADLTGDRGAFPDYNRRTIDAFKERFPHIKLQGEKS